MPEVLSGGVRLHYDDEGRGEPALLCLPGWCASSAMFSEVVPRLARRRRMLTLDWPGTGLSEQAPSDYGSAELADHALAVVQQARAGSVVPVAAAHAGWIAIELRRRLHGRVPKIVFIDWLVLEAPPPFMEALRGLQSPATWRRVRDDLFRTWLGGSENPAVVNLLRTDMAACDFDMWARAAREIQAAYQNGGVPLDVLASLRPPVWTLHVYSQPADREYLAAQEAFAARQPWFRVKKLWGRTHFPTLEMPAEVVRAVEDFVS